MLQSLVKAWESNCISLNVKLFINLLIIIVIELILMKMMMMNATVFEFECLYVLGFVLSAFCVLSPLFESLQCLIY